MVTQKTTLKIIIVIALVIVAWSFMYNSFKQEFPSQDQSNYKKLQRVAQENSGMMGSVGPDAIGIDPTVFLTTWNFNNLPDYERSRYYKENKCEKFLKLSYKCLSKCQVYFSNTKCLQVLFLFCHIC